MTIYWRKQEIIHNFENLDCFFWLSNWIGLTWKMESVALFRDDHNFKSFVKGKIDRNAVFCFWKPLQPVTAVSSYFLGTKYWKVLESIKILMTLDFRTGVCSERVIKSIYFLKRVMSWFSKETRWFSLCSYEVQYFLLKQSIQWNVNSNKKKQEKSPTI
jgi:hypothetical protein